MTTATATANTATSTTSAPRRPAHTREPFAAPTPTPSPAAAASPAPTPTAAPARHSTSTPTPRTHHHFDDADLPPWTAPAHPVPLPASFNPDTNLDTTASLAEPITPMQRWAHDLVLEMIRAQLPLEALAAQLGIPFSTLITYLNLPEVQSEINAYEELLTIRARLLGHTARPVSLRKLLDILESPAPRLTHHNPEADQRTLHRHAELIRRTATTITRESRGLAPKPAPAPEKLDDRRAQKGAPSASSGSSSSSSLRSQQVDPAGDLPPESSLKDDADSSRAACMGEDQACSNDSSTSINSSIDSHGCEDAAMPPAQEIIAPAVPLPIARSPLPPSPRSSASSASSAFNNSSSPLRDSASSAFSSRSRRTRDHPAPAA